MTAKGRHVVINFTSNRSIGVGSLLHKLKDEDSFLSPTKPDYWYTVEPDSPEIAKTILLGAPENELESLLQECKAVIADFEKRGERKIYHTIKISD